MCQDLTLFKQRLEEAGWNKEQIDAILETALQSIYPKKYGLVWEEKPEIVSEELKNKLPYFKEIGEREICLADKNSPQHLLIEGDNYEALKLLQVSHKGLIDVIYIDPPYNTGNKDFKYNDRYLDKDDEWKHSYWLSFMSKRLRLAYDLLSDVGVTFISIDDNEFAQLKLLCDEVFGELNVETLIWNKEAEGAAGTLKQTRRVRKIHEYVIACYKNKSKVLFKKISEPLKGQDNTISTANLAVTKSQQKEGHKNWYTLVAPNGKEWFKQWKFSKEKMEQFLKDDLIYWGKTGNNQPRLIIPKDERREVYATSIVLRGSTTQGKKDFENILHRSDFSYPKPLRLIKYLLNLYPCKDITIFDFFAGSGTTGHAVLDLNNEDGGNRQFILCTNNENNICEEVTYERLRRVIEGYQTPKGKEVAGIPANLKYFKVDKLNKEANTDEDLSYLYMPYVLPLLQLKHNAFTFVAQGDGAVVYEKDGFRFGIASDLATSSDLNLLSEQLKDFKGTKILYLFSTDTHSYPKYQQLSELEEIIQPIPREILNLLKGA